MIGSVNKFVSSNCLNSVASLNGVYWSSFAMFYLRNLDKPVNYCTLQPFCYRYYKESFVVKTISLWRFRIEVASRFDTSVSRVCLVFRLNRRPTIDNAKTFPYQVTIIWMTKLNIATVGVVWCMMRTILCLPWWHVIACVTVRYYNKRKSNPNYVRYSILVI